MPIVEVEEDSVIDLKESIKKQLILLCAGCNDKCKVEMQTSVDAEFQRFFSRLECS